MNAKEYIVEVVLACAACESGSATHNVMHLPHTELFMFTRPVAARAFARDVNEGLVPEYTSARPLFS